MSVGWLKDALLGAGSLSVLVTVLAAIDETVRRDLFEILQGQWPAALAIPDLRILQLGRSVVETIGLPSTALMPFAVFVGVSGVLFIVMFRM